MRAATWPDLAVYGSGVYGSAVYGRPGHPELVTHVDAGAGPDLVLPLGRHDLRVDAGDVEAGKQARAVVCLDELPTDGAACSGRAVVRPLRTRVAVLGPAQGPLGGRIQQCVLLLNAKPWLLRQHAWASVE